MIEAREARKLYQEIYSIIRREVRTLAALGRVSDVRRVIEESLTLPEKSGNHTLFFEFTSLRLVVILPLINLDFTFLCC